jgi:outer membrane protein TolC
MSKNKWLVALLALLSLGGVWAQSAEKTRLTVDEAVALAFKNNLSLQSGAVTLDTKKRKSDLVWNQFLPELAVRGTLAHQNKATTASGAAPLPWDDKMAAIPGLSKPMFETDIPGVGTIYNYMMPYSVDVPQWHVQGNFSASLTLSAALAQGIQSIKMDYQTGLLTYEKARVQTERDVRKAYNTMLLTIESVALLKESYASAERQVAMAQANYRAGMAPQLTLLQAQVARDNLKPNIDQAENGLKLAQANFAMSLGLPYDTQFELIPLAGEPGFLPLDLVELISRASRNKPEIRELQQQIATLEKSRTAQMLQARTPYLNLAWNYNPTFGGDPFKDSWFKKKSWSDGGTFSVTVGMTLNSLFPFTTQSQGIKDVDNQIKIAAIGMSQMIRGTELEVYNTLLSLERVQTTVEAQNQKVALAEQSYKLTEEAYRAGLQELLSVQNAELELRRARLGILEQQFNYQNGLIDLEYAIGVSFGTLAGNSL